MKQIKFAAELVPLVLSGEKTTTWRLWDDKELETGDIVEFVARPEMVVFAKAKLTNVIAKRMGEINMKDRKGHEGVGTTKVKMFEIYSDYYSRPVGEDTPVKIINFELMR